MWLLTMFLVPTALLTAGVALIVVGARGKLRGTGSYCRACGFSLEGLIESNPYIKCPECGQPLSVPKAVRRGQRVVRRWVLACGVVLAVASVPFIVRVARLDYRNMASLTPDSVLVEEAVMDRLDYRQQAELFKRITTGTLAPDVAKEMAAKILQGQRLGTSALSARLFAWFEMLRVGIPSSVSDEQWKAYIRGVSSPLSARVTPKEGVADVRLVWNDPRCAWPSALVYTMRITAVSVGKESVPVAAGARAIRLDLSPGDYEAFTDFKIPWPASDSAGPVTISWTRTVTQGLTVVDSWEESITVDRVETGTSPGRR